MEQKPGVELILETPEGGLKELVMKWFTETQAPLILNNGNFPGWFQGFVARKDTEDLLHDKALGCFLIRLTEKAIGYILSYKCRHFVITQNSDGKFVISGDCQTYSSLMELIEYYKVSPIQPFGECLTFSCHEASKSDLYDVVKYKNTSGVSVQALRTLWDQKKDQHSHQGWNQRTQQQDEPAAVQPPALPPKTKSRKLAGALSADPTSLQKSLPLVAKKGIPLSYTLSEHLPDTTSSPTETNLNRPQRLRDNTPSVLWSNRDPVSTTDTHCPDLGPLAATDSMLMQTEGRSKSLHRLPNNNTEEERSSQSDSPPFTSAASYSPTPLKKVTCVTYSLHEPRDGLKLSRFSLDGQSSDVELLRANPLYQESERSGSQSVQYGEGMYAEVSQRPTPAGLPAETYEEIPGIQGNTYESLSDIKESQKPKSTWAKNNMKWKKFLPDYMKR
ncbi:uncharacterized protein V6R79_008962 [Siganus canaliculatus]